MSTNSAIGILYKDNKVKTVYCHWDGYLSHNGKILLENYHTLEEVEELISKGNMSSLGEDIDKTSYYNEPNDEVYKDFISFLNEYKYHYEYLYLFNEIKNKWFFCYVVGEQLKQLTINDVEGD